MLTDQDQVRLARHLDAALHDASQLRIANLALLHGGTSRNTYSFDALYVSKDGPVKRGFVLRLDAKGRFMDAERALEYAAYRAVQGRGVPAPMPVALVDDESVLGAPFMLAERIEDAYAASPFRPQPYGIYAQSIGREFFAILGRLARIDPYQTEFPNICVIPDLEDCWSRELDHWSRVLEIDSLEPQPIAEAAIRRLRKNPPPPPRRLSIVHGDLRHGNFLHNGEGKIIAVLDWEMAHLGDPMEDLAWSLDPLWTQGDPDLAAGLIPRADAIKLWETASGMNFDPERFRWWSLFSGVKGLAIWASAARQYVEGKSKDPMRAFSGWYCTTRHNQILAERLAAAPRGGL
ncbi:MAG TPA: phosphotransferase family protein [Caulobacterales bacterium]|nr:phosphotransferase family protein [Caulobacterales bacterium]